LGSGLGGLNVDINNCKHIDQRSRLFHGDLLNSHDVGDPVTKDIDDFNVLNVWDRIPGVVETFHIISKALIMLLLDGLQGFSCGRTLVCALEVPNEHDA
jgi:hypothetical protein